MLKNIYGMQINDLDFKQYKGVIWNNNSEEELNNLNFYTIFSYRFRYLCIRTISKIRWRNN